MNDIVRIWDQQPVPYLSLLAFLLAALLALLVFYVAARRGVAGTAWKVLAVVGALAVLPSVVLGVVPRLLLEQANLLQPLAIVGLAGFALTLLASIGMMATPAPSQGITMNYAQVNVMAEPAPVSIAPPPVVATEPMPPLPRMDFAQQGPVSAGTVIVERNKKAPLLAWLVVRGGPHDGQDFRLDKITKLGRDNAQCTIVIDDSAMSRQHASIRLTDDGDFVITDLDSANGTLVNGKLIVREKLTNGDAIKLGETNLVFMRLEDKSQKPVD